jgi:hypothetical protein
MRRLDFEFLGHWSTLNNLHFFPKAMNNEKITQQQRAKKWSKWKKKNGK